MIAGRRLGRLLDDIRALRAEPQSPSKRPREAGARGAGEVSRALVLAGDCSCEGECCCDAPRAAAASPKRPRPPPKRVGVGLPCEACGHTLTAPAVKCSAFTTLPRRLCAPSAEALALAGWRHDRPP